MEWHWPQYVYAFLLGFVLLAGVVKAMAKNDNGDAALSIVCMAIQVWILHEGGFW